MIVLDQPVKGQKVYECSCVSCEDGCYKYYIETQTGANPRLYFPAQARDEEGPKVGSRSVTPIYQWRLLNSNGLELDLTKVRWLSSPEVASVVESLSDKRKLLKQPPRRASPLEAWRRQSRRKPGAAFPAWSSQAPLPPNRESAQSAWLSEPSSRDVSRRTTWTRRRSARRNSPSLQRETRRSLLRQPTAAARRKQSFLRQRLRKGLLSPCLLSATTQTLQRATRRRRIRRGASALRRPARNKIMRRTSNNNNNNSNNNDNHNNNNKHTRRRGTGPTRALQGASRATARRAPTRRIQATRASRFFGVAFSARLSLDRQSVTGTSGGLGQGPPREIGQPVHAENARQDRARGRAGEVAEGGHAPGGYSLLPEGAEPGYGTELASHDARHEGIVCRFRSDRPREGAGGSRSASPEAESLGVRGRGGALGFSPVLRIHPAGHRHAGFGRREAHAQAGAGVCPAPQQPPPSRHRGAAGVPPREAGQCQAPIGRARVRGTSPGTSFFGRAKERARTSGQKGKTKGKNEIATAPTPQS